MEIEKKIILTEKELSVLMENAFDAGRASEKEDYECWTTYERTYIKGILEKL